MRRPLVLAVVFAALMVVIGQLVYDAAATSEPPHAARRDAASTIPHRDGLSDHELTGFLEGVHAYNSYIEAAALHGYLAAVEAAADARQQAEARARRAREDAPRTGSTGSCSGDFGGLPIDIVRQESGCDYDAYNPDGCGGRGCYGASQWDPQTWAGYGCPGHPADASPAEQDACTRTAIEANGLSDWGR